MPVPVTPITPRADPLGEALHFLRMDGAFYCLSDLTAPWGFWLEPMPGHIWFHVVTAGAMWLDAGDDEPRALRPGELALVPHGRGPPALQRARACRRRTSTSSAWSASATATSS